MPEDDNQQLVVPVSEEELVTGTREVQTGSVRIRKEVERIQKKVEMPTIRDVVSVSRIPVNRVITSIPEMREEGDILIVPVVEEEIVVHKQLILKEEIHIQRRRVKDNAIKSVTLNREHATVERLDSAGEVIASSKPPTSPALEAPFFKKRKSLL